LNSFAILQSHCSHAIVSISLLNSMVLEPKRTIALVSANNNLTLQTWSRLWIFIKLYGLFCFFFWPNFCGARNGISSILLLNNMFIELFSFLHGSIPLLNSIILEPISYLWFACPCSIPLLKSMILEPQRTKVLNKSFSECHIDLTLQTWSRLWKRHWRLFKRQCLCCYCILHTSSTFSTVNPAFTSSGRLHCRL
jgi:hypothetical protein